MKQEPHPKYLHDLLAEFRSLPAETPWLEFKVNNSNPQDIGEYLSALSNAAALAGVPFGYVVWGIEDSTHEIVGTEFLPATAKKGNEPLENWLTRSLHPRLHFQWFEFQEEGHSIVILKVPRATTSPTRFGDTEFIRVGSCRQKLADHPQLEGELWRNFDKTPFEVTIAMEHVTGEDIVKLLDTSSYFSLLSLPSPETRGGTLEALASDGLIRSNGAQTWNITNLGAILFAHSLQDFPAVSRKSIRVIQYEGSDRLNTRREQEGHKGYATAFEGLIDYVHAISPQNEVIGKALRKTVPMYPSIAVRELIANALIHQDFSATGCGPMIEVFSDRMEVTNPGSPLVEVNRFLDSPPRSRNETLASLMRRLGICEERGSGIDKVVSQTEYYQLPAPYFEAPPNSTRVTLFAHRAFNEMDREQRVRACYLHAALRWVGRGTMTNTSLRERFGIEKQNSAIASRIIRDAIKDELVKPLHPDQSKKLSKYVPFWA